MSRRTLLAALPAVAVAPVAVMVRGDDAELLRFFAAWQTAISAFDKAGDRLDHFEEGTPEWHGVAALMVAGGRIRRERDML
jgi:hypothetical protein